MCDVTTDGRATLAEIVYPPPDDPIGMRNAFADALCQYGWKNLKDWATVREDICEEND